MVFCSTWRSDAPLVLSLAFQAPVLIFVSIASKRPVAIGVVVTPEGGVASAGTTINAAAMSAPTAAMAVRVRLRWTFIASPFVGADGRLACCRLVSHLVQEVVDLAVEGAVSRRSRGAATLPAQPHWSSLAGSGWRWGGPPRIRQVLYAGACPLPIFGR